MNNTKKITWNSHTGNIIASVNEYDIIECTCCGFNHCIPIPNDDQLHDIYTNKYYSDEKPDYIDSHIKDLNWWKSIYKRRLDFFEGLINKANRSLLDIGSGPGYFVRAAVDRAWKAKGVEPSRDAAAYSRQLNIDIDNNFFDLAYSETISNYDAINLGEVLEHINDPIAMLELVYKKLNPNGLVCITVPNDFNPIQKIITEQLDTPKWWVAPPHHINYFSFATLENLVEKIGFKVIHTESTFPIDIFLLMGENYIDNQSIGRICHEKRMQFEINLSNNQNANLLQSIYESLAKLNIGREVVLYAQKL